MKLVVVAVLLFQGKTGESFISSRRDKESNKTESDFHFTVRGDGFFLPLFKRIKNK